MKSLKNRIQESMITEYKAQDLDKDLMVDDRIIKSDITEDDLVNAGWGGSFMDDYSWIIVGNREYHKIKEDSWQGQSSQASVLSGTISSKKLFELIQKNPSDKGYKGELYKNNPRNVKL